MFVCAKYAFHSAPRLTSERAQVVGDDSQTLFAVVQPGQSIMTDPGGMLAYVPGIEPNCDMGGISLACQVCVRYFHHLQESGRHQVYTHYVHGHDAQRVMCAGESCFRVHWKNNTNQATVVAVGPSFPAKIVSLDLDQEVRKVWAYKVNLVCVHGGPCAVRENERFRGDEASVFMPGLPSQSVDLGHMRLTESCARARNLTGRGDEHQEDVVARM